MGFLFRTQNHVLEESELSKALHCQPKLYHRIIFILEVEGLRSLCEARWLLIVHRMIRSESRKTNDHFVDPEANAEIREADIEKIWGDPEN